MKRYLLFTLIIALINVTKSQAEKWRVNNDPTVNADFKTLQGAIDTANTGDTLYVEGTQFEYVCDSISKQLVIQGPGYFLEENDSTLYQKAPALVRGISNNIYVCKNAEHTKISGFKIIPGSVFHVLCDNVTIARNCFELPNLDKIDVDDNVSNTVIKQNYIYGTIWLNNSLNTIIQNNIIIGRIRSSNTGSAIVHHNIFRGIMVNNSEIKNNIQYKVGNNAGSLGTNNIYENNVMCAEWAPDTEENVVLDDNSNIFFEDNPQYDNDTKYSTDGRFQLAPDSPAKGAGANGVNCGAFSGISNYVLSGIPGGPVIYDADIPAVADEELPVTIKVKVQE